ncbi:hypothetical protein D3C78_1558310 [compost metagenome]
MAAAGQPQAEGLHVRGLRAIGEQVAHGLHADQGFVVVETAARKVRLAHHRERVESGRLREVREPGQAGAADEVGSQGHGRLRFPRAGDN